MWILGIQLMFWWSIVFESLNVKAGILLTCATRTISLRWEVWVHKTSLTPPRFIAVAVPCQRSEPSCICFDRGIDFDSLNDYSIGFWNCYDLIWSLVFNATFSNISAISWRLVLMVEEAGVPGENHRPWARNW